MTLKAKKEHEIAFQELNALCKRMADDHQLTKLELLAVAANMLGKMIALQDQRYVSPARAMDVVKHNLEIGNKQAVEALRDVEPGGSA